MATLDLNNISKSFGETKVLYDIQLSIRDKEFVVFVGPSGCGKSTLLRIIAGLEEATNGSVVIDGENVSLAHPVDRGISMVFQSYALYPHLSVFENIAFPLRVAKMPEAELKERVARAADILQLNDKLKLKPAQLSGGQRQRVAIGRSIVREPKIFLFDEPLSNLDAALRGDMRVELSQLHRDLQATMVYVTHDQIEAMTMADRIVVLNQGRVEQFGTPMELYHHPATKFVASFIGQPNMNFLPAKVTGTDADGLSVQMENGLQLKLPVETGSASIGENVDIGIRPENIAQGPKGLKLNVSVVERLGGTSITYGTTDAGTRICAALDGVAKVREGETTELTLDPRDCHVFDASGTVMRRLQAPKISG